MTPYYSDDYVTLYNADNRDVLPELGRFDLCLTDPPYGIGRDGQTRSIGAHGGRKFYERMGWDNSTPESAVFREMFSVSDIQIIWGGNYFAPFLPASAGWIVWDKGQRISQSDGELAFTSMDSALRIFTLNRVAIMQDGACHPTQKPVELMRWCITLADKKKRVETILDPFAGSCTTGRAAKDLGRKCVLIEREERYCEIGAKRLMQEAIRFDAPEPKPTTTELF